MRLVGAGTLATHFVICGRRLRGTPIIVDLALLIRARRLLHRITLRWWLLIGIYALRWECAERLTMGTVDGCLPRLRV